MRIFGSFNILIPKIEYMQKWPVIACDQFTSQPEYWNELRKTIGYKLPALHCIMLEAELGTATDGLIDKRLFPITITSEILQQKKKLLFYNGNVDETVSDNRRAD